MAGERGGGERETGVLRKRDRQERTDRDRHRQTDKKSDRQTKRGQRERRGESVREQERGGGGYRRWLAQTYSLVLAAVLQNGSMRVKFCSAVS